MKEQRIENFDSFDAKTLTPNYRLLQTRRGLQCRPKSRAALPYLM